MPAPTPRWTPCRRPVRNSCAPISPGPSTTRRAAQAWYDWLLPRIAARFELLPCIHYTPPSLSRTGTTAGAPHRLQDYADFVDHALTRYGSHFKSIELWNEPNNLLDWDWREDREWLLFCEMVGGAAYWARQRGFGTVLGGCRPMMRNGCA